MATEPYKLGISEYADLAKEGAGVGFTAGIADLVQDVSGGAARGALSLEANIEAALKSLGEDDEAFEAEKERALLRNLLALKAMELTSPVPEGFYTEPGTRADTAVENLFKEKPHLQQMMAEGGTPAELAFGIPFGLGKYSAVAPLSAAAGTGLFTMMGVGALEGGALGLLEGASRQLDLDPTTRADVGEIGKQTAMGTGAGLVGGVLGKGLHMGASVGKRVIGKTLEGVAQRVQASGQRRVQQMQNMSRRRFKSLNEAKAAEADMVQVEGKPVSERDIQVLKARKQQLDQRQQLASEAAEAIETRKQDIASLKNKPADIEDAAMARETMARLDEVNAQIKGVRGQKAEVQTRLDEAQTRIKELKETVATRREEVKELKVAKTKAQKEVKRLKGIKSKRNAKQRPEQIKALEKELQSLDGKIRSKEESLVKRQAESVEWEKDASMAQESLSQLDNTTRQLEMRHKNTLDALDESLGIKQKEQAMEQMTEEVDTLQKYIDNSKENLPMTETEREIIENVRGLRDADPEQYKAVVKTVEEDVELRKLQAQKKEKPGKFQKEAMVQKEFEGASAQSFLGKMVEKGMTVYRAGSDAVTFLKKIGAEDIANDYNAAMNTPAITSRLYKQKVEDLTGLSFKQFRQVYKKLDKKALQNGEWDGFTDLERRVALANEEVLGEIHTSLRAAGVDVPDRIQNYAPRKRVRPDKYLKELEKEGIITREERESYLQQVLDQLETSVETEDSIMQRVVGERQIKKIPEKMLDLYEDNLVALDSHLKSTGTQLSLARMFKGQDLKKSKSVADLITEKILMGRKSGKLTELQGIQAMKALTEAYTPGEYNSFWKVWNTMVNAGLLSSGQTTAIQLTSVPRNMSRFGLSETFAAMLDYVRPGSGRLKTSDLNFKVLNDLETNEGALQVISDRMVLLPFHKANQMEASLTLNTAHKWLRRNAELKLKKGTGTTNFERFLENWVAPEDRVEILTDFASNKKFTAKTLNTVLSAARNVGGQVLSKGDKASLASTKVGKNFFYPVKSFQIKNANILLDRTVGEVGRDFGNAAQNFTRALALEIAPTAALRVYFASLAGYGIAGAASYVQEFGDQMLENFIPLANKYSFDNFMEGRDPTGAFLDFLRPGASNVVKGTGEAVKLAAAGEPLAILDPNTNKQFGKLPPRWITEPIAASSRQGAFTKAERMKRSDINEELAKYKRGEKYAKLGIDPREAVKDSPTAQAEFSRRQAMKSSYGKYRTADPRKAAIYDNRQKAYELIEKKLKFRLLEDIDRGRLTKQQARRIMEGARRDEIPKLLQKQFKEGKFR